MAGTRASSRRRRLSRSGRAFLVVGLAILLLGLVDGPAGRVPSFIGHATAAGGGGGGGSGGGSVLNLTINLTDAPAFSPATVEVSAPVSVNVTLVNTGALNHSFTLLNRPNFALNRSWTPTQITTYFSVNGSQADITLPGGNRSSVMLRFETAQSGFSFEFVSRVPYQFQAGMMGFLNVTGAPSGPGLVANISAAAGTFAWLPNAIGVDTASFPVTVDMAISNAGSDLHTFWIEGQPNVTLIAGNFTTYFDSHPPLAKITVPTNPGDIAWANFTIQKPGIYEYICNVPGHFSAGMFGFLYIGVPLPAPPALPSTDLVSAWVLYLGGGLLGVGSLLAGAALLVGRFPRSPGGGHGH